MILEYLSDGPDAGSTVLGDLACACERRGGALMDVVQNTGSRPQQSGERVALGGYSPVGPASGIAPMDSRYVFAPLVQATTPRCRTCGGRGRGDVNVNVNVATGTKSSAGPEAAGERRAMPMPTFEGGIRQERVQEKSAGGASSAVSSADMRRIIAEELRRVPQAAQPQPVPGVSSRSIPTPTTTTIEYRPFAVPRDRVVVRREQRPFAVVWDRIKRIVQPRDINHPIDRVRLVPGRSTRPMFEGSRGAVPQGGSIQQGNMAPQGSAA